MGRDVKTMRCCQEAVSSPTVVQSGIRFPLSQQRVFGSQTGRPIGMSNKRPFHTESQVLTSQKVHCMSSIIKHLGWSDAYEPR